MWIGFLITSHVTHHDYWFKPPRRDRTLRFMTKNKQLLPTVHSSTIKPTTTVLLSPGERIGFGDSSSLLHGTRNAFQKAWIPAHGSSTEISNVSKYSPVKRLVLFTFPTHLFVYHKYFAPLTSRGVLNRLFQPQLIQEAIRPRRSWITIVWVLVVGTGYVCLIGRK